MKHTIIQAIFLVLTITLFNSGVMVASTWPRMQNRVSEKPSSQQSQNPKNTPTKKKGPVAEDLSDAEISEARRLLDQLGYWVSLDATRNVIKMNRNRVTFRIAATLANVAIIFINIAAYRTLRRAE